MPIAPRTTPEPAPVEGARWIPLTKGRFALVDADDFDRLSQFKWCAGPKGMASRGTTAGGKTKTFLMHREVLRAPKGVQVDHVNMNQLDNRKSNLRLANDQQNRANQPKQRNNTSGFKGVTLAYQTQSGPRWTAKIEVGARTIHLGVFSNPRDAAKAYDEAALKHFGKFARINGVE